MISYLIEEKTDLFLNILLEVNEFIPFVDKLNFDKMSHMINFREIKGEESVDYNTLQEVLHHIMLLIK